MYKLCLVLLVVTTTLAFPQKKGDNLEDVIEQVFGPENKTPASTTVSEFNLNAEIDKIFGNDANKPRQTSTKPYYQAVETVSEINLDAELDKIFGKDAKKPSTTSAKPNYQAVETGKKCAKQPGVCVRFYLCRNPLFSTNHGEIDLAGGLDNNDECESYLDVCCNENDIIAEAPKA